MDGIDSDIVRLDGLSRAQSLDRLEADIWAGVAARVQARQASRLILSSQAAVMAVALFGGIAAGAFAAASATNVPQELSSFSTRMAFAPSTLLLGSHR